MCTCCVCMSGCCVRVYLAIGRNFLIGTGQSQNGGPTERHGSVCSVYHRCASMHMPGFMAHAEPAEPAAARTRAGRVCVLLQKGRGCACACSTGRWRPGSVRARCALHAAAMRACVHGAMVHCMAGAPIDRECTCAAHVGIRGLSACPQLPWARRARAHARVLPGVLI